MGLAGHRGWLWFSVGVLAFLAQHALQGWCPPMPVFRYLGTRTGELHQRSCSPLPCRQTCSRWPSAQASIDVQLEQRRVRRPAGCRRAS